MPIQFQVQVGIIQVTVQAKVGRQALRRVYVRAAYLRVALEWVGRRRFCRGEASHVPFSSREAFKVQGSIP